MFSQRSTRFGRRSSSIALPYNLVDKAESEPEAAFAVNALGVRNLALACRDLDATFVHVSTDYVFGLDSSRRVPWKETDAPGPVSAYGLSKLTGEYWARQTTAKHVVVRTCGLYGVRGTGGKGGNFVETMLRVAGEGKPLRVVGDQRCTPSFVGDVAAAMIQLIDSGQIRPVSSHECGRLFLARIRRPRFSGQSGLRPDLSSIPSANTKLPPSGRLTACWLATTLMQAGCRHCGPGRTLYRNTSASA